MADETKPVVKAVEPKEEPKEKTVAVPETVLKDILDRMEKQAAQISDLKEAQKEYEQTATQDQILKIEKLRASGKLIKAIRLNYYDNNLVVSWASTADDVYIETGTGKEISVQKTKLTFADGKTMDIPQLDFNRRKMQRQYEVIKEGKDRDGQMLYTVMTEGGKEVEINGAFVN